MFKRCDMTGEEYKKSLLKSEMRRKPIVVRRARKLAIKLKEVFDKYPDIVIFSLYEKEVAFYKDGAKDIGNIFSATLITKLYVSNDEKIISAVLKEYGYEVRPHIGYNGVYWVKKIVTDNTESV